MLDIPALRQLCEAATVGPWTADSEWVVADRLGRPGGETILHAKYRDNTDAKADAAFIAAARTALPAALDEIEALRATLDAIKAERDRAVEAVETLRKAAADLIGLIDNDHNRGLSGFYLQRERFVAIRTALASVGKVGA